jgi:serine-type D-Ala-D-Ala carboxypeptidase/endopeptidase (penicillin-binding protein 4)
MNCSKISVMKVTLKPLIKNFAKSEHMKTTFITFIFLVYSFGFIAQNTVQDAVNKLKNDPELANASISIQVTEAGNGKQIASYQPNLSIASASTAKLFATAGAIELLGPDYRPQTRIYAEGNVSGSTLNGNLRIRGGGDITLGSRFFTESGEPSSFLLKWVDSIKKTGIELITGDIIADGSEFGYAGVPDGWSWNDMGNYYGAGPSGISIYDNALNYYFKTGSTPGQAASFLGTFPDIEGLQFRNGIIADKVSGDNSYIYGSPFSNDRFGIGSLPLNHPRFEVKGSMPDPEYQLAVEFYQALLKAGIKIQGKAQGYRRSGLTGKTDWSKGHTLLFSHYGPKVQEIAILTNMKSINLFAEGLICLIGYKISGKGTTEEGLRQLEAFLTGKMNLSGLFLKDGSGLSRSNGISASHFVGLLNLMYNSARYDNFYATLPEAGKNGTISSLCKGQPGECRIFAKSGTMNRIKSYAGYAYSKSGKKLVFAITISNFNCSSSAVTRKMEPVLNAIALY